MREDSGSVMFVRRSSLIKMIVSVTYVAVAIAIFVASLGFHSSLACKVDYVMIWLSLF